MELHMILETFLFETIDLIPMVILALVPFHDRIRFSLPKTAIIFLFLYICLPLCRIVALKHSSLSGILSVLWIGIYLSAYKLCVQASISRLLFVLLLILNYGSFISIILNSIIIYTLPQLLQRTYCWERSLITFIILLASYPIVFILMEKKVRPLIAFPENNKIWRILWIVPATFCFYYYYNLYLYGGVIAFSSQFRNVLFGIFLTIGAIFITYIAVLLVQESNLSMQLKSENYQLSLQSLQFEYLQHKIDEARHARHDIHQIMTVLNAYITDEDIEGLKAYTLQYTKELPSDSTIVYCEHYALNALLLYYEALAKKYNISFQAKVEAINFSEFSDSELTILFGNLLENAVEACIRQQFNSKFIHIHVQAINSKIMIYIVNSYNGEFQKTANHEYLSSKGERTGIGMMSIKRIVKEHNGIIKIIPDADKFSVSILFF